MDSKDYTSIEHFTILCVIPLQFEYNELISVWANAPINQLLLSRLSITLFSVLNYRATVFTLHLLLYKEAFYISNVG